MRAAVMRDGAVVATTVADPTPGPGEVLVHTLACGICGSDLHAVQHGPKLVESSRAMGMPVVMDLARDVVLGHEFCAEIVDYGPETTRRLPPKTRVCSVPILPRAQGALPIGFANDVPGGYGELMVLSELFLLPVPDSLPSDRAALTEPMAVGIHAVARADLGRHDVPLVIGCGPVGLAVIAALKLRGAGPIVAADFSPARRDLAAKVGADVVVDPAQHSPYGRWQDVAPARSAEEAGPPSLLMPLAQPMRPAVVFECVGVPGVVDAIFRGAPPNARIVVVGVCMEPDTVQPLYALSKELDLRFAFYYTPDEYAEALQALADGRIDGAPLLTGHVGIDAVPGAFTELANPERHAKIIVTP